MMRNAPALLFALLAAPVLAVPLPSEVGLTAADPVGEVAGGAPILPSLDLKSVTVRESAESVIELTIETEGSLEAPETGAFKDKLSYLFYLDIDNDAFTGTNWGADFSIDLRYEIASKKWTCEFGRLSEAYSQRMRITAEIQPPKDNRIAVTVNSALFLSANGGVWGMETKGDDQVADVIAPDRQNPARIARGASPAYDAPERQGTYFDILAAGETASRTFDVPDRFATIKGRLHVRNFAPGEAGAIRVEFFFGGKPEAGRPYFGVAAKGGDAVARIGLRGEKKVDELALGKDKPALGRDLNLKLERKGSWLAYFVDDQLVGSINAKGLISNARLLTMQVTGAEVRSDQFEFAAEVAEKKEE